MLAKKLLNIAKEAIKKKDDTEERIEFYQASLYEFVDVLGIVAEEGKSDCVINPRDFGLNIPREVLLRYLRGEGFFCSIDTHSGRDLFDYKIFVSWGED